MKKRFIALSIIMFIFFAVFYIVFYPKKINQKPDTPSIDLNNLKELVEQNDDYLLVANYYTLKTKITSNKITISFTNDNSNGKLVGTLKEDILSFKIKNDDTNASLKAKLIYSIVDALGQINGNKKGYVSSMLGEYNLKSATLEKEGIELMSEDNTNIYQFKTNKKYKLGKLSNVYFKPSDLSDKKDTFTTENYLQMTKGNIVLYKDTDFYKNNIIYLAELNKLTNRSYNSLISIIEIVYGEEYKNQFIASYSKLQTTKVLDKFDITVDYQPTDQDVITKFVTNNYKIVKIVYQS